MKNVIGVILVLIVSAIVLYSGGYYKDEGEIIHVENNMIVVRDRTTHIWDFEGTGYTVGDKVLITFFNNYTDSENRDDCIIQVEQLY